MSKYFLVWRTKRCAGWTLLRKVVCWLFMSALACGIYSTGAIADDLPVPVTLNPPTYTSDAMMGWTGVELGWSATTDGDIQNYKIYRSTSPGVTEESALVATIDPKYGDPYYGSTTSPLIPTHLPRFHREQLIITVFL